MTAMTPLAVNALLVRFARGLGDGALGHVGASSSASGPAP
jgi:hypothetical protein